MSTALPISQTLPCELSVATNDSQARSRQQQNHTSDITELVLTKHSPDAELLLLPMLAHLSRDAERWITWICDSKIDRQHLENYGVDMDKIRIIYSDQLNNTHWVLWEALNAGTSHTVIATPGLLGDDDMRHFEEAAQAGSSRGLFIRYR